MPLVNPRAVRLPKWFSPTLVLVMICLMTLELSSLVRAESQLEALDDVRLQPLKDLKGYFPFTPPEDLDAWHKRAEEVRRRILVSQGLWPMPTKLPLQPVIHGRIERDGYAIEKVYFQSAPGFFVTGNLYRPSAPAGKVPAVLFAHGHWQDARLSLQPTDKLRKEIATGEERFEQGGQSRFQSMCVQLARMGCVVWQWDMLSDSDSIQIGRSVIHRFDKQRPEMNAKENWGLFSPQAESHLQNVMGLQTWNAIRSLDFVLELPEVDAQRIAITGASGGGTQTMLLAAIDPRVTLSFPAVMVSTAMQGGCTCENASLLRIGTGNVEFAALFAPKPQGMTTANDWTKEMATKGFPELQALYKLAGAPKNVMLQRGEYFPHNYNAVTRSAFYTWLNRHFHLGAEEPVIERDYEPLPPEKLSVWDDQHPAPAREDPQFERQLLRWFHEDANKQLEKAVRNVEQSQSVLRPALETVIGRTYEAAGEISWKLANKLDRGNYVVMEGILRNESHREALPVLWFYPKAWNEKAVLWLTRSGKAGLMNADGSPNPAIQKLVDEGWTVLGVDLLMQGDFTKDARFSEINRIVDNPREFAGYTYGYNHALFAQRTHDVLSLIRFLRTAKVGQHPNPSLVALVALDETGPIAAAARMLAGEEIQRCAIDTRGFRFGALADYRDAMFLPGGAKYLDLPGMLALHAPHPLWLAGETTNKASLDLIQQSFVLHQSADKLVVAKTSAQDHDTAVVAWLNQ